MTIDIGKLFEDNYFEQYDVTYTNKLISMPEKAATGTLYTWLTFQIK